MLTAVLVDDIKTQITAAMKSGDAVARDILRLAVSEIQTAEARKNAPASDEEAAAALRKLIKSNEETLGLSDGATGEGAATLRREIEILSAFLPQQLSVDDIVTALAPQHEAIKAAKGDGQATGIAMKHLKSTGASVSGNDVGAAVKKLRA
jgi:uncharacterized protein YqeY